MISKQYLVVALRVQGKLPQGFLHTKLNYLTVVALCVQLQLPQGSLHTEIPVMLYCNCPLDFSQILKNTPYKKFNFSKFVLQVNTGNILQF